jgi:hypothetical protein
MDRALGGSGSPQNVNKTGGELDASKNGTEKVNFLNFKFFWILM